MAMASPQCHRVHEVTETGLAVVVLIVFPFCLWGFAHVKFPFYFYSVSNPICAVSRLYSSCSFHFFCPFRFRSAPFRFASVQRAAC